LQMLASYWTPIALLAWVRVVRTRAWGWAVMLGVACAAQAWTSMHWGIFLALGLGTTAGFALLLSRDARAALPQVVGAAILAGVLWVPLVAAYHAVSWEWDLERRGAPWGFFPLFIIPPFHRAWSYLAEQVVTGTRVQSVATLTPWISIGVGSLVA